MKIGVFSIVSKNYLAYARVLMESIAQVHPEYSRFLCLADRVDGYFDPKQELFQLVQADQIGIPFFYDMTLRYDIMEFNTAVKPFMFLWLFENTDLDAIIYLDPDIHVYSRFDLLEEKLEQESSVVLTPHITSPLEDGKNPNDHQIMQAGVFNLGFMAAKRNKDAQNFIRWWSRRLQTQCTVDFSNGLFTDQKWCDFAPCFVDQLTVLKDPGYNVAYWNLGQRNVHISAAKKWQVDNRPLVFFHFSGVSAEKKTTVSKHQNRFKWNDIKPYQSLFNQYTNALIKADWKTSCSWSYAYAIFPKVRETSLLFYQLYQQENPEPIKLDKGPTIRFIANLCNKPETKISKDNGLRITCLMYAVWRALPDLQAAFNLETIEGRRDFAHWFEISGERNYKLPAQITRQSLIINTPYLHPALANKILNSNYGMTTNIEKLYDDADIPQLLENETITNLMLMIWNQRQDIQSVYDIDTQKGQQGFLNWYKHSVLREYGFDPNTTMLDIINNPPNSPLYLENLGHQLRQLSRGFPNFTRVLGKKFWFWCLDLANRYISRFDATYLHQQSAIPGANLIGYTFTESGMGEHVRMSVDSFSTSNIKFNIVDCANNISSRQKANFAHKKNISVLNPYKANILHLNIDQIFNLYATKGSRFFYNRTNILYPFWELSKLPEDWIFPLNFMDEIWAPTQFIKSVIENVTDTPVYYMPVGLELPYVRQRSRKYFKIPENRYLFFYSFDFFSYIDRKNPWGTIKAFQKAFPNGNENVALIIKVMNTSKNENKWEKLKEFSSKDKRITLINKTMNKNDVLSLVSACDCYVSLHRAEGLGLGPMEAMLLGKPTIVTNYSGNTDYSKSDNSCLVDYSLIPVKEGQYVRFKDQVWADPDIEQAAWYMRKLVNDAAFGAQIGKKAKEFISNHYNPSRAGKNYKHRLNDLGLLEEKSPRKSLPHGAPPSADW